MGNDKASGDSEHTQDHIDTGLVECMWHQRVEEAAASLVAN